MPVTLGRPAPDFTLSTHNGEKVTLADYRGKNVLLLFFPFAFTGVCTDELCATRDNITLYNSANAQVFGISVDSPFTLEQFAKANNINFPLLSDFNKDTAAAYGALYEDFIGFRGVAKRSAFVVDGEGNLQYVEVLENPKELPNFAAIQEKLKELS